jgi:hydrophobic/amphiphilic exporter-1 (mainly G- bacteria), HAE1 family
LNPRQATISAMGEISSAIVAITLVMSAVFIPVAFMSGPVGVFYRQFSLTLAIAIVISGVNALTLTPALCAIILKRHMHHKPRTLLNRFFSSFNWGYEKFEDTFKSVITRVAARRAITVLLLIIFCILTAVSNKVLPTGFIPEEDQGMIYVSVNAPAGATVERTETVMDQIQQVAEKMPAVESVSTLAGYSLITEGAGASFGMGMVNLKPWDDREESVDDLIAKLNDATTHIKDASIEFFAPPTVPGFGNASGFEIRLIDKTGTGNLQQTARVANEFIDSLQATPEIGSAFSSFDASFPQYLIKIDQELAAQKGVTIDNAMSNLQTLIGSYYTSNFIRFGQMYKVMVQASPEYRTQPEDVLKLQVKNQYGEMVPYASFAAMERVYGPEQLTRYNMFTAAMINGNAAEGYSSGDAISAIERVAEKTLPRGFSVEWSGMTREEILSGGQAIYIFAICLVFVYLLLAAQYESFMLPLPVILSLPTGIFGSYLFLYITGLQNNIFAQVALVMLIGLLGKNAILIVEFAVLKQKAGASVVTAAIEGAIARLRPILMTSLAFVAGLIPLCIASGAGAMGNKSIGITAAGGMLTGTVFGLVIIPGLYIIFAGFEQRWKNKSTANL